MQGDETTTTICEKCQYPNQISLNYFIGFDNKLPKSVIAVCKNCNTDFVATIEE